MADPSKHRYTWDTAKREFATYLHEQKRGSAVIRLPKALAELDLFQHKEKVELVPDLKNHALLIIRKL